MFSFGDSLIIKIRIAKNNTRQEPKILELLATKREQPSFDIPTVLFYSEDASTMIPVATTIMWMYVRRNATREITRSTNIVRSESAWRNNATP